MQRSALDTHSISICHCTVVIGTQDNTSTILHIKKEHNSFLQLLSNQSYTKTHMTHTFMRYIHTFIRNIPNKVILYTYRCCIYDEEERRNDRSLLIRDNGLRYVSSMCLANSFCPLAYPACTMDTRLS